MPTGYLRTVFMTDGFNAAKIRFLVNCLERNLLDTFLRKKKQKRNGKRNKKMDAEEIHPGVQDGSFKLLLHTWRTSAQDL